MGAHLNGLSARGFEDYLLEDGMRYEDGTCPADVKFVRVSYENVRDIVDRMFSGLPTFLITAWPIFALAHPTFAASEMESGMMDRYGTPHRLFGAYPGYRGGGIEFTAAAIVKMVERSREENPWFHYEATPVPITWEFVTAYCWALCEQMVARKVIVGMSNGSDGG